MYDWLSTVNDKFWLILNYSKVVWDIDTKFSPVVVLMSFQLSTKFEGHNLLKKTAMPLGSSKWKWAWRAHFLSHTYETQKICCFLADVQIILVSLFEFFDYIKVAKNAGAFLSRCSELLELTYVINMVDLPQSWTHPTLHCTVCRDCVLSIWNKITASS